MANVTKIGGGVIDVVLDGATDWALTTDVLPKHPEFTGGIRILKIRAKGSATDDVLVVRHAVSAGTTGPRLTNEKFVSAYDSRDIAFGEAGTKCMPSVDSTEGSANVQFSIQYL